MNRFPYGIKAALAAACLLFSTLVQHGRAQPIKQDTVAAAMTLQILEFTEWPKDSGVPTTKRIGIVNSANAQEAFESLISNSRFDGRFELLPIDKDSSEEDVASCQAFYFSDDNPTENPRIIRKADSKPIVLIGTYEGFLEDGGMVNIVTRQKRLTFRIHQGNSKQRGIEYRAKLLRLAERIVE